jgi:hypothetical protein
MTTIISHYEHREHLWDSVVGSRLDWHVKSRDLNIKSGIYLSYLALAFILSQII